MFALAFPNVCVDSFACDCVSQCLYCCACGAYVSKCLYGLLSVCLGSCAMPAPMLNCVSGEKKTDLKHRALLKD